MQYFSPPQFSPFQQAQPQFQQCSTCPGNGGYNNYNPGYFHPQQVYYPQQQQQQPMWPQSQYYPQAYGGGFWPFACGQQGRFY